MNIPKPKTANMVLLLTLSISGLLVGQDATQETPQRSWRTGLVWNGRFWKGSNPFVKTGFLLGYEQAFAYRSAMDGMELSKFEELKKRFWPTLTLNEIESALDRFYDTPENGPVQITDALRVVAAKANGGSADEIEQLAEESRKSAAATLAIEHR